MILKNAPDYPDIDPKNFRNNIRLKFGGFKKMS